MPVTDAPTTELGTPGLVGHRWLETWEETRELVWPASTVVFDRMRKSDGKLAAVRQAYRRPILRSAPRLDTDGVDPGVAAHVAANLGLPLPGEARVRRRRGGVNFRELVSHALLALDFGHFAAEVVYEVGAPLDGVTRTQGLGAEVANLRKLGPRMPRSITDIIVGPDGGLAGIAQDVPVAGPAGAYERRIIPVDRLLYFVNDREGAEWAGQSIHRAAYKHWLIRDALLRLGPQIVERNGMGVPVVGYPDGADRELALSIARGFRMGEDAGVALPQGWTLELVGVSGSTRDELPLVKYHDEAMGKASLTMFLDLGHDAGARSLGDTFVDVFGLALSGAAQDIADTITDYLVRDLVELNYGPGVAYPRLVFDDLTQRADLAPEGIKTLVDAGLLAPDEPMRSFVRTRYGFPSAPVAEAGTEEASAPFQTVGLPALVQARIITEEEARRLIGLTGTGPGPLPVPALLAAAAAPTPQTITATRLALGLDDADPLATRLAGITERLARLRGA